MKKLLAVIIVLCMIFTLFACNKDSSETKNTQGTGNEAAGSSTTGSVNTGSETTQNGNVTDSAGARQSGDPVSARDTLTIAITGDNGTLLPSEIFGSGGIVGVIRQYTEVLYDLAENGDPIWVLATDIEQGLDEWIIHLREGVTFSNGNKFDAHDVMFSLDRYVINGTSGNRTIFDWEKSYIIDDYTVCLGVADYSIQQLGSFTQYYMYDEESFDADEFVTNPIGTGPYIVTEYVTNSHIYLEARDDYWGEQPKIKNLKYRIFKEEAQIINAIQTNLVDISVVVPLQEIDYIESSMPQYNVTEYLTCWCPTVNFNCSENSEMFNLDARLAVCHALNRQAVINLVYFGYATLADYMVSSNCFDYEPRLGGLNPTYSIGHDLDLAREYAEKAGLVGKDLVAITNGQAAYIATAEILQANLREIGVNLIINNYDGASYSTVAADQTMYDIILYASASPQFLALGQIYDSLKNRPQRYAPGWPEFYDWLDLTAEGCRIIDMEERSDLLYQSTEMFVNGAPWYAICTTQSFICINKDLAFPGFHYNGNMCFNEWWWTA